jgi:hypothetical protein
MTILARFHPAKWLPLLALTVFAALPANAAGTSAPVAKPDTYTSHESTKTTAGVGEDWKGQPSTSQGSFSGLLGLSVLDDYRPAFALIGAASKKIIDRGFVPDVNDSVSIEVEMGPAFALGGVAFVYSAHLRWDFIYNSDWTFYALGGLGGSVQGDTFGNHFILLPRIGAGAIWSITEAIGIRAELSHELIVVGATFPF